MKLKAIYYDTETTGLKADHDRIIEIAAYDATNNRSFSTLVNPQRSIPEESMKITGINDEMVKDAPTFEKAGQDFIDFCGENAVLIAHNHDGFDKYFLKAEFERCNLTPYPWQSIDTLKWARKYRSDLPKHNLQYLREVYGFDANNAHRALDDVIIMHKVFSKMTLDLSIEQIIELMKTQPKITRMPFGKHKGKLIKELPKNYVDWLKDSGALEKENNLPLLEELKNVGLIEV
ncbi:MAG TPA: DUF3820 family protein [Chlamydiales bacterium]|nr:DUF3820 family protein [Chlamydiales bacterium]